MLLPRVLLLGEEQRPQAMSHSTPYKEGRWPQRVQAAKGKAEAWAEPRASSLLPGQRLILENCRAIPAICALMPRLSMLIALPGG